MLLAADLLRLTIPGVAMEGHDLSKEIDYRPELTGNRKEQNEKTLYRRATTAVRSDNVRSTSETARSSNT